MFSTILFSFLSDMYILPELSSSKYMFYLNYGAVPQVYSTISCLNYGAVNCCQRYLSISEKSILAVESREIGVIETCPFCMMACTSVPSSSSRIRSPAIVRGLPLGHAFFDIGFKDLLARRALYRSISSAWKGILIFADQHFPAFPSSAHCGQSC